MPLEGFIKNQLLIFLWLVKLSITAGDTDQFAGKMCAIAYIMLKITEGI